MKKNPQMPSARRILGMVVGIVIIGLGWALHCSSSLTLATTPSAH